MLKNIDQLIGSFKEKLIQDGRIKSREFLSKTLSSQSLAQDFKIRRIKSPWFISKGKYNPLRWVRLAYEKFQINTLQQHQATHRICFRD